MMAKGRTFKGAWDGSAKFLGDLGRKNSSMTAAEKFASGKRRRNVAVAAPPGMYAINRMRSPGSSGRDGMEPHSTGGYSV